MAEEFDDERAQAVNDSIAAQLALTGGSEEARDYLKKHSRLLDLQIENLQKQDEYEVSHLRWRRFNDQMRGAMQIMLVAVGALIVVVIGAAIWNASQANGLVVDAFTVPPDFESHGMGGDVIAGDLTNRLASIRQIATGNSYSSSNDVRQNRVNEIKVEIPETGVSISEAWRYLRSWLGRERHLTGSLRDLGDGKIVLSVSVDDAGALTETGTRTDLPKLEQKAAEDIFGEADPVNHINYLSATSRHQAAYEAALGYLSIARSVLERSDSYGLLSYTTARATGDISLALARAHVGMTIDPSLGVLHVQALHFDRYLGHSEDELREARAILPLKNEDQLPAHQGGGFLEMQQEAHEAISEMLGDFSSEVALGCHIQCSASLRLIFRASYEASAHGVSQSRSLLTEAFAAGPVDPGSAAEVRYYEDSETGNWNKAAADASVSRADWIVPDGDISRQYLEVTARVHFDPLIALAEAHAGQFSAAHREIDKTPADCVSCETARGEIDALEKNWSGAAFWFARAASDAPSVPFADSDWGAMLMVRGDLDGAITKFATANEKGPHFADPLEMWGEALMAQNRSDLALAKFAEANKVAPNWGRLHLKWGEALFYFGKPDAAKAQFAVASHLDLSRNDAATLARWMHS